jgi:hypothetical protein
MYEPGFIKDTRPLISERISQRCSKTPVRVTNSISDMGIRELISAMPPVYTFSSPKHLDALPGDEGPGSMPHK